MKYSFFLILLLFLPNSILCQPYSGTIFINPDIITPADSSAIESITYSGQKMVRMYDRRVNNSITVNAYTFNLTFNDGLKSIVLVNPEFENLDIAQIEAEKYGFCIGQLPYCLRVNIHEILIHKGTKPFGGGNNGVLIHTGQSLNYEKDGILEETLIHEACHTSLDYNIYNSSNWDLAVSKDNAFISIYAKDHPNREDVAESFLPWLMVKYRSKKITDSTFAKITKTIPNRLKYFDSKNYNLFPLKL